MGRAQLHQRHGPARALLDHVDPTGRQRRDRTGSADERPADRKAAPRTKRVRIEVQMTDKEKKQVTKKAKSLGVTITNFIKNLLFRKINF